MADSTLVKYSGDWIFYQGLVAPGATLTVLNAGGADNDYADIFTDSDLVTPSANPLTADSGGLLPFAYVGTNPYKIILKTSAGVEIKTQDNIPGAISSQVSANFALPIEEVVELTADTTLGTAHIGATLNCTPSSTFTVTLGSAVTIGDGKGFRIVHSGTANQVNIVSSNGETIVRNNKSVTAFSLVRFGHAVKILSDGANWIVVSETKPGIVTEGIILPVKDRVSAAPSTPAGGEFFIVSSAYSTYSVGDVLEADGQGGFTAHTPYTDCGWIAYVQDENLYYEFQDSAWVAQTATSSFAGRIKVATQAVMETATANDTAVTPGTQKFHPGHPKAWGFYNGSTSTLVTSWNVASVTRDGTGDYTVAFSNAMSSTNYAVVATCDQGFLAYANNRTTGGFDLGVTDNNQDSSKDAGVYFAVFGDQ